jgi:hypothetical protein
MTGRREGERKKSPVPRRELRQNLVDATTLVVLATIVQTVVITLTLLVFIFQFRSQERALKEESYQNLLGRYNDFMMNFVGSPELGRFYTRRLSQVTDRKVDSENATAYGHLMVACGIIEEAYALYRKGWIDADNWQQWANWLKALSANPEFDVVADVSRGTFDKEFEDLMTKVLEEGKVAPPDGNK